MSSEVHIIYSGVRCVSLETRLWKSSHAQLLILIGSHSQLLILIGSHSKLLILIGSYFSAYILGMLIWYFQRGALYAYVSYGGF